MSDTADSRESLLATVDEASARDRTWDATMELLARRPLPFQSWRVRKLAGLSRQHDRTIRRTLRLLVAAEWLAHEDGSSWWHPGPKARELFAEGASEVPEVAERRETR